MSYTAKIFSIIVSIGIFLFIFDLVRRRKLAEEYSIFWLAASAAILVVSIWNNILFRISKALGIADAMSLLFILLVVFFISYSLHLSIRLSKLAREFKEIVQWVGLLRQNSSAESNSEYSGNAIKEQVNLPKDK